MLPSLSRASLVAVLLGVAGLAVAEPQPKPSLEEAYRGWYKEFSSTKKEDWEKTLRSMMPEKKDVEYLFPKHAEKLWLAGKRFFAT